MGWLNKTDQEWMELWKKEEVEHRFSETYEMDKQENLLMLRDGRKNKKRKDEQGLSKDL